MENIQLSNMEMEEILIGLVERYKQYKKFNSTGRMAEIVSLGRKLSEEFEGVSGADYGWFDRCLNR